MINLRVQINHQNTKILLSFKNYLHNWEAFLIGEFRLYSLENLMLLPKFK